MYRSRSSHIKVDKCSSKAAFYFTQLVFSLYTCCFRINSSGLTTNTEYVLLVLFLLNQYWDTEHFWKNELDSFRRRSVKLRGRLSASRLSRYNSRSFFSLNSRKELWSVFKSRFEVGAFHDHTEINIISGGVTSRRIVKSRIWMFDVCVRPSSIGLPPPPPLEKA